MASTFWALPAPSWDVDDASASIGTFGPGFGPTARLTSSHHRCGGGTNQGSSLLFRLIPARTGDRFAAACAPAVPPSGGLVGLGTYSGQIANVSVYYQYDGVTGEQLNVGLSVVPIDFSFSEANLNLVVYAPDNSQPPTVRPMSCGLTTCTAAYLLPVDGRYTIALETINPLNTMPHSYGLTLSHDELRGPVPFEAPIPGPALGQVFTYSYAGTAGESLNSFLATVLDPVGNTVLNGTGNATLPTTGSYTIVIKGNSAVLSHDVVGGPVTIGENTASPLLSGQRQTFTHVGTAGEALGFFAEEARITLYDPSHATLFSANGSPSRRGAPCGRDLSAQRRQHELLLVDGALLVSHDVDGGVITPGVVQAPLLDPGQAIAHQTRALRERRCRSPPPSPFPGSVPR